MESNIEELEMDRISDRLFIDVLESHINTGTDELQVGGVVICSPKDLKENLVVTNSEGVNFVGFVCPYNILTCIQQRLKSEDTLA